MPVRIAREANAAFELQVFGEWSVLNQRRTEFAVVLADVDRRVDGDSSATRAQQIAGLLGLVSLKHQLVFAICRAERKLQAVSGPRRLDAILAQDHP